MEAEIDRVLYDVWDPIGVRGRAPRDEYRSYVPALAALLQSGATEAALAAHLRDLRTRRMGLPPHDDRDAAVAATLATLRND